MRKLTKSGLKVVEVAKPYEGKLVTNDTALHFSIPSHIRKYLELEYSYV